MLCVCLGFSTNLWSQARTVTGRVLGSDTGGPLSFASVVVKGATTLGGYTDDNGRFSLPNVPANATHLVVGSVGYTTVEVDITGRNSIEVTLVAESFALNEIVVTALGIQRQAKELGYATAKVGGDDLTNAKGADASAALIGKVSGLQINMSGYGLESEARVNLRGSRSFKGSNQAMLVLDGVPQDMVVLQQLNPNDIENVSVMKGGSAAALYGSAAANGVIYVTTKKGDRGRPRIQYSYSMSFSDATAYLPKWQTRFGGGLDDSITGLPKYDKTENQQYGPEFDGLLVDIGSPLYLPGATTAADGKQLTGIYSARKNAREDFYKTGVSFQNDISYSSGDETGNMFFSYQRVDTQGQIPGDEGVRQGLRFNASRRYGKLRLSANVNYTNMNNKANNASNSGVYALMSMAVNHAVADYKDWRNTEGGRPDEWIGSNYYNNPYFEIDMNRRDRVIDRFSGSADLEFKALPWLTFQGRGSISVNTTSQEDRQYAWNYNTSWGSTVGRSFGRNKRYSSYEIQGSYNQQVTFDAMAMAERKINKDFNLNGMVGWSLKDNYSSRNMTRAGSLAIDDFFNLKNKTGELTGTNSWNQRRSVSVYGNARLGYKNWAFLELTGRNDWNSLLHPDNWSFFYPGANVSVVLSDAIPSIKSGYISHLKLRATAAKTGTVNMQVYDLEDLASPADGTLGYPFGSLSSYRLSTDLRNPAIQPEFTTEFEFGVEMGLLKDRITFEAAVYQQTTDNQTVNVSIPWSSGFNTMFLNAGVMRGRGLELDLRLTPLLRLGDFRWNFSANFTMQESVVTEIYGGLDELATDANYGNYFAKVGKPYPWFKGSDWARDDQGRVIVNSSTGYPAAGAGLVDMGTMVPKYIVGLSSRLRWKSLELNITADYRAGHIARFASESSMLFQGTSYISSLMGRQRFVFPNSVIANGDGTYSPNTNITTASGGRNFWTSAYSAVASTQVVSGNSWRIREVSLRYNVPENVVSKLKVFQSASISLVGRNIALWTPNTNYWGDPDMFTTGNNNSPGYQAQGRSATRTYGFDISLRF